MSQSLAELGWRTFNFYKQVPVQDPGNPANKASILQGVVIQCWESGDGFVLFGEPKGALFQLDKDLAIRFFKPFGKRLIHFAHARDLLIALGEDLVDENTPTSAAGVPVLKMWYLDKWEEAITPKCTLSYPLNLGRKIDTGKACAVAVSQSLNVLVVGLSNTTLLYHFGSLQRERFIPKFRSLREGTTTFGSGQLVGIAIGECRDRTVICCIAERTLNSYILGPDGNVLQTVVHDAKGCARNCWYFSPSTNQLVVAGREMVYFYNLADCLEIGGENGRCHALGRGADKVQLIELDGMLALLTEQEAHIQSTPSSSSNPGSSAMMSLLNIYDIDMRYIAFFCSMPSPCHLFVLNSEIYLLNAEGTLSKLVEEDLASKMDILLRKNLFDLAISIAQRDKSNEELCHSIHKQYGDYLFKKGDFENAMRQFVETIGFVEPSNIITKFLDGPRVLQLSQYLEALHHRGQAIGQHSTLLICAYVKLNAFRELNEFIDSGHKYLCGEGFDAESSIRLLRTAQMFSAAAKLALKCQKPHMFLDILCQDTKEYLNALRFIEKLPIERGCHFLELYGHVLVEHVEDETIKLIKQIMVSKEANLHKLTKILMTRPRKMEELFSELNMDGELKDPQLRKTLLEQRLKEQHGKELSKEQFEEIIQLVGPDNFEQALLLEQCYKCPPLVVHILRAQNRKEELLRYLLKEGEVLEAIHVCGEQSLRDMWVELISYLSSSTKETKKQSLLELLKCVSQSGLLHPMVVLELLSRDDSLQVGDIKEYIISWLERQHDTLKGNEQLLAEQNKQLADMEAEINDLENNVQVFQVSKCAVCNNPLQVPAVHFLCRHSYHANCFESYSGNQPDQCPACISRERRKEGGTASANEEGQQQKRELPSYQQFRNELNNSTDVMSLISNYLANDVFVDEMPSQSTMPKKPSMNPFDED